MNLSRQIILIAAVAVTAAGCSRKPPQKFKVDEPAVTIPAVETGTKIPGVSEAVAMAAVGAPIPPGMWSLAIDSRLSMRSTTMATTQVDSSTLLKISSRVTAEGSELSVLDTSSEFVALEKQPEMQDKVRETYKGLTVMVSRGPDGAIVARPAGENAIPGELADALQLLLPVLPRQPDTTGRNWEVSWNRSMELPGGTPSTEKITGKWRVEGSAGQSLVLVQDFSSRATGSATVESVAGRVTDSRRLGRTVCVVGPGGLERASLSESRTWSVELKPRKGKKKLLEQKVTVTATLSPLTGGETARR